MQYTLYIDESGDFLSQRGEWVVAGFLVGMQIDAADNKLGEVCQPVIESYGMNISQCHLTELRKEISSTAAVDLADNLITRVFKEIHPVYLTATVNNTKKNMSDRERTYRVMVQDIISTIESMISINDSLDSLNICIATRTIDGILATTNSQIKNDILDFLPEALEMGLASRGIIKLLTKNLIKIELIQANRKWGLIIADFLANMIYNKNRNNEKELLEQWRKNNKLMLFESFGGYEARRARVAESDMNYPLAILYWSLIKCSNDMKTQRDNELLRLFSLLRIKSGATGPRAILLSVHELFRSIERSDVSVYKVHLEACKNIENALLCVSGNDANALLFIHRNYMLAISNHIGDVNEEERLLTEQKKHELTLLLSPDYFSNVLDFKLRSIEHNINELSIKEAVGEAQQYYDLLVKYNEIFSLFSDEAKDEFQKSRLWIRAVMTLSRVDIYERAMNGIFNYSDIIDDLGEILNDELNTGDRSRLLNYIRQAQIKNGDAENVVRELIKIENENLSLYDIYTLTFAANTIAIKDYKKNKELVLLTHSKLTNCKKLESGHPVELIWRELALLEFFVGNIKNSQEAIEKSFDAIKSGLYESSPIAMWISGTINIYKDKIYNRTHDIESYFPSNVENIDNYIECVKKLSDQIGVFKAIRHITPY